MFANWSEKTQISGGVVTPKKTDAFPQRIARLGRAWLAEQQGAFSEAGAATKLAEQGAVHIHTWELVEKPEDQWKNYGFYLRKYMICAYIYRERDIDIDIDRYRYTVDRNYKKPWRRSKNHDFFFWRFL